MNRNGRTLFEFERLASKARTEPVPVCDVTDRVMTTLRSRRVEQARAQAAERDVALFCVGSFAVAMASALVFWLSGSDDVLAPLVQSFVTVLP